VFSWQNDSSNGHNREYATNRSASYRETPPGLIGISEVMIRFLLLCLMLAVLPSIAHADDDPNRIVPARKGQYIRSIKIKVGEVFEDTSSFLYRTANSIKIQTREDVVRRELLFKEGDPYIPFKLQETARNLRLLRYLRAVKVTPTFDGDAVDVLVETRDTWTLIPFLSYSSGTGGRNRGVGLTDSNLLGSAARIDTRYEEEYTRQSYGVLYTDPQFLGTRRNFLVGASDRSDGKTYQLGGGLPFRSLMQQDAWRMDTAGANTIGRLFKNGTEDYIFRQHLDDFSALYTFAGPTKAFAEESQNYTGIYRGQKLLSQRFSVGYRYEAASFYQADAQDYKDLDLNPAEVSNDPSRLPSLRRFSGPVFQYQNIQPNFMTLTYIDRFDRPEDYNLGDESLLNVQIAPRTLGSAENALIPSFNRSRGWRFSDSSMLRGEIGGSGRWEEDRLANTLLRTEVKYYSILGDWFWGDQYLGKHTFATNFFIDFGENLDRDRQLPLGADTGLRGYEAFTFEGDKRLVLNIEERTHLVDDVAQLISLGTALFVDVGAASRDALGTMVTDDLYGDFGFGLRLGFPRASGSGVVRIDVAFPFRDGPDGSGAFEPRVVFAAGQLFGARLRSEQVGGQAASVGVGFDR
jgi:outer membrane protein assembly factor BamA